LSPSHKEALAAVIYGIEKRKGFVAITGEVGVGKTTILRSYLERNAKEQLHTIYLFNANVSYPVLLKTICRELELPVVDGDSDVMLRYLHQFLISEYQQGRNVALVIDEAQNTPIETLENLRMLSNLETATEKLIQIVFSGQSEFDQILDRHELRQLKQRIAVRATITALTKEESFAYVRHRLAKALIRDGEILTPGALKQIIKHARGVPRAINILCDNALITAFGYQKKQVNRAIVREIINDFTTKRRRHFPYFRWMAVSLSLLAASAIGWIYLDSHHLSNRTVQHTPDKVNVAIARNNVAKPDSLQKEPSASVKKISKVTRVANPGDKQKKLVTTANGIRDRNLKSQVKQHNQGIRDSEKIMPGNTVAKANATEKNYAECMERVFNNQPLPASAQSAMDSFITAEAQCSAVKSTRKYVFRN